jgi:signal transduction histidine kinase
MADGGRLHLRVSSITLNGVLCARLTIADTGTGIRGEIRSSLFNQFFTTKGNRGTGLGLWLTRDIVLRNSGRLRYRSRTGPHSGTVFTIYLPMRAPAAFEQSEDPPAREESVTIEAA